jgi:hypothetical protein
VIQGQEALQDFRIGQGRGPPIGGRDGFVEFAMGIG